MHKRLNFCCEFVMMLQWLSFFLSLSLFLSVFYPLSDPSDVPACWWRLDEQREVRFLSSALSFPLVFPQHATKQRWLLSLCQSPAFNLQRPAPQFQTSFIFCPSSPGRSSKPLSSTMQSSSNPYSAFKGSRHPCTVRNSSWETLQRRKLKGCFCRIPWELLWHTTVSHGSTAWLTF